jgi:phage terminase large subunit-like protein
MLIVLLMPPERPPLEVKSASGLPTRPIPLSDLAEFRAALEELSPDELREALFAAGETFARSVDEEWPVWVREGQAPLGDDWTVWVIMAGRGFGKTRAGAEWVSQQARDRPEARIALVAATPEEARRVMVEGPSGLLACARSDERRFTRWEPGLKRLTFASGAVAFVYSGADGETLRGPEHHFAWCDELAKWRRAQQAWDNLMLGLRAGERPRAVVTTTPRSIPALKAVLDMGEVEVTRGTTRDNPHVAPAYVRTMERLHAGTRLGRQELEGQLIEDVEGALFKRDLLERCRETITPADALPHRRVVIGVDPPVTAEGDACGIVVCALGRDDRLRVLADLSVAGLSPEAWARKVAAAAEDWSADRVVAEGNQGGEMVEAVLRAAGRWMPVKRVHAHQGKVRRAEPVVAVFERSMAHLYGRFPELEDELAGLVTGGAYAGPGRSPDRADAMIYAMTELMAPKHEPRIRRL